MASAAFSVLGDAFLDASLRAPAELRDVRLSLCGHLVALRIIGASLATQLLRPFAHLQTNRTGSVDLTIDLWDESVTGVANPFRYTREAFSVTRPWGAGVLGGEIADDVNGFHTSGALTVIDRPAKRVVGWVRGLEHLTHYERGKPLQPVLVHWYRDIGVLPVHAGMVARGGNGLLIGGAGGSGKTTTTLLCLRAGLEALGDDCVAVARGTPSAAHSLHGSMWLETDHAQRFPWLAGAAGADPDARGKILYLPAEFQAGRMVGTATVRGLLFPRFSGAAHSRVTRATPGEALRRLAPSSLFQLPFSPGAEGFHRMAELAETLPAWWLDFSAGMRDVPECVERALSEAA